MASDLILAAAYADMADSMAFKDFLVWLTEWVEEAESRAASLKPENKEHFESYFMAWQERKKLVAELKHHIEIAKQVHKEQHLERPSAEYSGDPVSTSNYPSPATESVGSGPNQVIFENAPPVEAPPPAAPPVSQEWGGMHQLENGSWEMTLNSGNVYRADTPEALAQEVGKAQYHATRTIAELKGKTPPLPTPEPVTSGVDPTALAIADLVAQADGFKNHQEKTAHYQQIEQFVQSQQLNNIANAFLSQVPGLSYVGCQC